MQRDTPTPFPGRIVFPTPDVPNMPLLTTTLDHLLLTSLQHCEVFATHDTVGMPSKDAMASMSYTQCLDANHPPGHIYYEGYLHGMATNDSVLSVNPRYGTMMKKTAAPLELRGFLEAFRRENTTALTAMLLGAHLKTTTVSHLFADVAAQSHHGVCVKPRTGWHYDAGNSWLHMALSIHGTRVLSYKSGDHEECEEHDLSLTAGEVYVSSPFGFMHSVGYPEAAWKERVLAVQCRTILMEDNVDEVSRMSSKKETVRGIVDAINNNPLRMPSMAFVLAVTAELAGAQGVPSVRVATPPNSQVVGNPGQWEMPGGNPIPVAGEFQWQPYGK